MIALPGLVTRDGAERLSRVPGELPPTQCLLAASHVPPLADALARGDRITEGDIAGADRVDLGRPHQVSASVPAIKSPERLMAARSRGGGGGLGA